MKSESTRGSFFVALGSRRVTTRCRRRRAGPPPYLWQPGQKQVPRPPTTVRTMVPPQRRQTSPCLP